MNFKYLYKYEKKCKNPKFNLPTPIRGVPDPPPPLIKEKNGEKFKFYKKKSFEVNILCKEMNLVLNCSENPFAFDVFY